MKHSTLYKNGNTLSYIDYGDKDSFPILIQHGLIASIEDVHLFERLRRLGTRLICMARPGYGESSPYPMRTIAEWAEVAAVVIEALQIEQFDVLGMSSGAPYSYALGYTFPERARNMFIFSGTPALYDEQVVAQWPFPVTKNANLTEMQALAQELFFSNLSEEELKKKDIRDSRRNECFGIGLDLKLRGMDWGFKLEDVKQPVYMQHSRFDSNVPFATAERTASLLPNCTLTAKENDVHFSPEALDRFIEATMAGHYEEENGERGLR